MDIFTTLLLVVHLLVAVAVCGFVLLQHGKGADMGAAFGSGASGSLFGAVGSANFLSRTTAVLAAIFFVTSLGLTWLGTNRAGGKGALEGGVMQSAPATTQKASDVPAAPAGTAGSPAEPAKSQAPASAPVAPAAPAAPAGGASGSKAGDVPK